jgi:hypothetical protein
MRKKKTKEEVYVAVVMTANKVTSDRPEGDWAAFVGENKDDVINRAVKAKTKWELPGTYGPYVILVGKLTELAVPVSQFQLKPL